MSVERASQFLETVEKGEKPWYLSSTDIYTFVKKTASSIPHSRPIVEKSIKSISDATKYINESTHLNVAIDADQAVKDMLRTICFVCFFTYSSVPTV